MSHSSPRSHGVLSGLRAVAGLSWRAASVHLIAIVISALAVGTLPVVAAWLTKTVIDRLVTSGTAVESWFPAAVGLVSATLVAGVLPRIVQYLRSEMDRAAALLAQDRLFGAVGNFSGLARFEDPAFLDRLRLAQQSGGHAPGDVVSGAVEVFGGVVTALGFLGSLLLLSPGLAVVVAIAAVPVLLVELNLSRQTASMLWSVSGPERREFFYAGLLSSVQAAKEIRLFGSGWYLRHRMLEERRKVNVERRRMDQRTLRSHGTLAILSAVVGGAGLLWAIFLATRGQISVGDVSLFIAAVGGVQESTATVTSSTANMHQQLLMFDHYLMVVRADDDLPAPAHPRALPRIPKGIELRDVWFRYSPDHPWVLRGVNLIIPHGKATALVGRNGSGKSTLVKLLCRFYDPTRGAILWDGIDIRDVPLQDLRARVGAVFQDYVCYDLSANENIGLGDVTAFEDPGRIERAAEAAGIHDTLVGLPNGYQTLLTRMFISEADKEDPETGVVLSGGQWQRLSLARAFLRAQCDLLILDEPSSGLDAVAEYEIHSRLREKRAGRTSLLISHRLGAIRDADLIVVLSHGVIAEQGAHEELVDRAGEYGTLFHLQASGYTPGPSVKREATT